MINEALNKLAPSARNQLQALPVDFVELFESVAEVEIEDNPWSDLPPKWGKLWEHKHRSHHFRLS
jgi:hypothetical protein